MPRGGIAWPSRTITLTTASRGRPRSRTRWPTIASSAADRVLEDLRAEPADRAALGERPRQRGLGRRDARACGPAARTSCPARSSRPATAKKTMLKSSLRARDARRSPGRSRAPPAPPRAGRPSRGSARSRPREVREQRRRRSPPAAARRRRPRSPAPCPRRRRRPAATGNTSRPSVRNMPSCATQARPWWKEVIVCWAGIVRRAEHQPGEVDGEEARAVQRVGAAEGQRGRRQRGDRVEPGGRELRAPEALDREPADAEADDEADAELLRRAAPPCRRGRSRGAGSTR